MQNRLMRHTIIPLLHFVVLQPVAASATTTLGSAICSERIPGIPTELPASELPFTGAGTEWSRIAQAIAKSSWSDAKLAFERSSAFRARAYTGVHEPADTLYREGSYHDAFVSYYQLAFCRSGTSMLSLKDGAAAPLYRKALESAVQGLYEAAKTALMQDIKAHPTFLLGKNTMAELYAITSYRSDSRSGWANVALSGHLSPSGKPNDESLGAVEMLLYADRGIVAQTAGVSDIKITDPVAVATPFAMHRTESATVPGSSPNPMASSTSAAGSASVVATSGSFDVVSSWSDAAPSNVALGMHYYHVRLYLHPTSTVAVHSRDFKVDGLTAGRAETYVGLPSSAPMVPKVSFATGRAVSTYVPSVERTEDLGALYDLQLGNGDKKTVVVTFALPVQASLSDAQLQSLRWSPETK